MTIERILWSLSWKFSEGFEEYRESAWEWWKKKEKLSWGEDKKKKSENFFGEIVKS